MSFDYSVGLVEQALIIYQHQFSTTLCLNENRAAVIFYYKCQFPLESS